MPIFPIGALKELLVAEKVEGIHSHVANTTDQDVFEFDPQTIPSALESVWLDMSNLTRPTRIKVYHKVDGINYEQFEEITWKASMSKGVVIPGLAVAYPIKVVLGSAVAEAGPLDVPWYYLKRSMG